MTDYTISIVVPCHNEASNLDTLIEAINALPATEHFTQIILVDDGSKDNTWDVITRLTSSHPAVSGLRLSRNFGHQYALFAGLSHATADAVITLDGDMQHPPELIPKLIEHWRNGAQVVSTIRQNTKSESAFKKWTSSMFYRFFSFLSGVPLHQGMADFRLLDRRVVDALKQFGEEGLFLRGLIQWVGYRTASVEYAPNARLSGETSYTLRRMIKFAWTGITSFSIVPLRLSIVIGLITSCLAFAELIYAVVIKITVGTTIPGWASAVSIVSLLFGILFIMLGVLGEYVGRILTEVRGRPRYLISDEVGAIVTGRKTVAEEPIIPAEPHQPPLVAKR